MIDFKLTEKEEKDALEFSKEHKKCTNGKLTTIGGRISYEITPVSIGHFVSIVCNICGKKKNITDYDSL